MHTREITLITRARLGNVGAVQALEFTSEGELLVGSTNRFMRRFRQRGDELQERACFEHRWGVRALAVSDAAQWVAAGDAYGGLMLFNKKLRMTDQRADPSEEARLVSLDFHPSQPLLLAVVEDADAENRIDLLDIVSGHLQLRLSIPVAARAARFTRGGNTIIAAGGSLWRIALDGTVVDQAACSRYPLDLALSQDDRTAVVASADPALRTGEVLLYALEPRLHRVARQDHPSFVLSAAIGPAGHIVVSSDVTTVGGHDGSVTVLRPRGAKLVQLGSQAVPGSVTRVRISPDGAAVAAATSAGELVVMVGQQSR